MSDAASLDGVLAAVVAGLPGGTGRPGQQVMARAVQDAIASGRHLLVEAGTGTGKSIAYLVPALLSEHRVVVSTSTKALQAQLVEVDLPRLVDQLAPALGRRPVVAILKGRANYLCQARLESSTAQEELVLPMTQVQADAPDDRSGGSRTGSLGEAVLGLRAWAKTTPTGDRSEVPVDLPVPERAWQLLSVTSHECVGAQRCPRGDDCFAELARQRADVADLVVTNHSMLALDVTSAGRVLPEHAAVVIDEAHDFVDRVTDAMSQELGAAVLERLSAQLTRHVGEQVAEAVRLASVAVLSAMAALAPGRLTSLPGSLALSLPPLDSALTGASRELGELAKTLDTAAAAPLAVLKGQVDAVTSTLGRLQEWNGDDVVWLDRPERGRPALVVAPLDVAGPLGARLFTDRTVIATSATLTAGGGFQGFARRVGLVDADGWTPLDVGSPFSYDTQALLYVAAQLPDPSTDREGHAQAVRDHLVELVHAAGGRTLGLFTSAAAAAEAALHLRAAGVHGVLMQGESSLARLVEQFKENPRTVLLGTLSLWQGVDVPGASCQLVVLDKLPFPRPDDPLASARLEAAGRWGFREVFVSHAATLLAQGAGRLIRSAEDRGVVALLDPRVVTKPYGRAVLDALPPMRRSTDTQAVLAALRRLDQSALGAAG